MGSKVESVFEDAISVRVLRGRLTFPYNSWERALPHIEIGDRLRIEMRDGTTQCAEAVKRHYAAPDALKWKPVARPC